MKLSGSYSSIARGVSQQVPQQRVDGQHAAQVNMVSDPVVGVARRKGSLAKALFTEVQLSEQTPYRNFDFIQGDYHYSLLYPTQSTPAVPVQKAYVLVNRSTMQHYPVRAVGAGAGLALTALQSGLTAVTQANDILVMSGNYQPKAYTESENLVTQQRVGVAWVRAGNFNRKYSLKVSYTLNGVAGLIDASYTTPSATYPGALDTSDLDYTAQDYTKQVNDRVNAYQSATTQWLTTAAEQSTPAYIANELVQAVNNALTGLGVTTVTAYLVSTNHVAIFEHGTQVIRNVSLSDGGDGSAVRSVWQEVKSLDELPYAANHNMVVAVRPNDGADAFYMRAEVKVPDSGAGVWGQAQWVEYTQSVVTPTNMFLIGVIHNSELLVSHDPADLNAAITGLNLPMYGRRRAGDDDTVPIPVFFTRPITYLGTFQDRLVVGTDNTLAMSAPGDYFNFFRPSVLTVKDNDAIEVTAVGAEDDAIRHSVLFDRSIVFFGDRQQYTIDGRNSVTPSTTSVIQSSAHEDATDAPPVSRGELVFFAKRREGMTKVHQMEMGDMQDTSRTQEISLQLSDFIKGRPVQLLAVTNPDMLLIRSTGDPYGMSVFRYLDRANERLLDSWSRWEYSPDLGYIIGMSAFEDQVLIYHSQGTRLLITSQPLMTEVSERPYLDGSSQYGTAIANQFRDVLPYAVAAAASAGEAYLHGEPRLDSNLGTRDSTGYTQLKLDFPNLQDSDIYVGVPFEAYLTLTSPFKRDDNGIAITTGRLTVGRVDVSYRDTVGLRGIIHTRTGDKQVLNFNGKLLGTQSSTFEYRLGTSSIPCFIGRESREYTLTLKAQDWKPFTLTAVEWTGQYFYNARR